MRDRGLSFSNRDRTWDYVDALRMSDLDVLKKYWQWKEVKELVGRKHTETMLASAYNEEPGRKGFMDMPGEIRNMVYNNVLFDCVTDRTDEWGLTDEWQTWYSNTEEWDMWYDAEDDRLRTSISYSYMGVDKVTIMARLRILSAMSRQVRQEARGMFWSKLRHRLIHEKWCEQDEDMCEFELIQRYLHKIGLEGRAAIPRLPLKLADSHLGYAGRNRFRGLGRLLQPCLSLQRIDIDIGLSHIFWDDRQQLEDHFLRDETITSPGLDDFIRILQSLPRLRNVSIKLIPSFQLSYRLWREEPDRFLQFAFSGVRECSLYLLMYERLHADHVRLHQGEPHSFGNMTVWLGFPPYLLDEDGSEIEEFTRWLTWRDQKVEELRQEDLLLKTKRGR